MNLFKGTFDVPDDVEIRFEKSGTIVRMILADPDGGELIFPLQAHHALQVRHGSNRVLEIDKVVPIRRAAPSLHGGAA